MHWDHEPTPSPSKEGSRTAWPSPLPGGVRGGFVVDGSWKAFTSILSCIGLEPVGRVTPCAPQLGNAQTARRGVTRPTFRFMQSRRSHCRPGHFFFSADLTSTNSGFKLLFGTATKWKGAVNA